MDLTTPDVDNAERFYGELFGWEAWSPGPEEETGGYKFFLSGGRKVAGVGPLMGEAPVPLWSTYFATDDVDALAERVAEFGGDVLLRADGRHGRRPHGLLLASRGGRVRRLAGGRAQGRRARQRAGQPRLEHADHAQPGGRAAFFGMVFGLSTETQVFGGDEYVVLTLGETAVAGLMSPPPGLPEGVPAFWGVSFAVEDADATAALAVERGGSLLPEPMDMPGIGRIAAVTDPWGASFSVAALAP